MGGGDQGRGGEQRDGQARPTVHDGGDRGEPGAPPNGLRGHLLPAPARSRDGDRRDAGDPRRAHCGGQGAPFRHQQLRGLGDGGHGPPLPAPRGAAAGRLPALLQHPEPGRRSRDLSRRPPLRDRRGGLQPARRRPADRQVPWRGREGRTRAREATPVTPRSSFTTPRSMRRGASRITPKGEAWPRPVSRPAGPSTTPT